MLSSRLLPWTAIPFVLLSLGCADRPSQGEPVVVTYFGDSTPTSDGMPDISIEGALMTSSSETTRSPARVVDLTGTIDGASAVGFALYEQRSSKGPVFRVLAATSKKNRERVAVLEGDSDVRWQLVVNSERTAVIQAVTGTLLQPDNVIKKGKFRVEVRMPEVTERKATLPETPEIAPSLQGESVVLTYYSDSTPASDGMPDISIEGALMTSSSETTHRWRLRGRVCLV